MERYAQGACAPAMKIDTTLCMKEMEYYLVREYLRGNQRTKAGSM